jgi:hypothetical protein
VPAATSAAADYLVIPANLNSTTVSSAITYSSRTRGSSFPRQQARCDITKRRFPYGAEFRNGGRPFAAEQFRDTAPCEGASRAQASGRADFISGSEEGRRSPLLGFDCYSRGRRQAELQGPWPDDSCNNFTTITAEAKYINEKVIIFSDVASPAGGFTSRIQQIGDEFRDLIYPTDLAYFGTPLDDDNNGRIIIPLYARGIQADSDRESEQLRRRIFSGPVTVSCIGSEPQPTRCPQSNVAEMFYLHTPDRRGPSNNIRNTTTVRQGTRGTIAHEFQHMINASERIRSPILQEFEDVWLDEGLAHFAEDAVGRVVRGLGETEDAGFSRVLGGSADDFNAFFNQNFARFRLYLLERISLSGER